MFWFMLMLVAGAAHARVYSPPYVQSKEGFTHAKLFISEYLPPENPEVYDPTASKHYSFGILAGATAAQVTANKTAPDYSPMLVLDKAVPFVWRNYNKISESGHTLLNDAAGKIQVIEDLINNICDSESVSECNTKVHTRVVKNPYAYKQSAELLLQLGKFSEMLRKLEPVINATTSARTEIPYLINNVNDPKYKDIIDQLVIVHRLMKRIQFRRFNHNFGVI